MTGTGSASENVFDDIPVAVVMTATGVRGMAFKGGLDLKTTGTAMPLENLLFAESVQCKQ